jgi:GNAT superfamily N-acetyltransferase
MAKKNGAGELTIVPLTAARMDDLGKVLRGTWGSACWCMYPRLTSQEERALAPSSDERRRRMTALARKRRAPGLLAYRAGEAVGWVAIAPRPELVRIDTSKGTPRVDAVNVWAIPCVTVLARARGAGVAVALIGAAVAYAKKHGAPAVEAYPRASDERVDDDMAYIGTRKLFHRAGFRAIREPPEDRPKNRIPRVTMRIACNGAS